MLPVGSKWTKRNLAIAGLVVSAIIVTVTAFQLHRLQRWFVEHPFPLTETHRLFDMGVVDANGDDFLDIYTSNHHFRQALLITDGNGGYHDVLSEWGLDQSKEFPLAELSFVAPTFDKSGLYIYWFGTQLIIRAHQIANPRDWRGTLRVNDPVDIIRNNEFLVQKQDQVSSTSETVIEFSPNGNGFLRMRPGGQGLPIKFDFSNTVPTTQIYVGRGKIAPSSTSFSVAMRDRHAMAWADYNADGILDVFINRGALSGTLRAHETTVRQTIKDEFLESRGEGKFHDVVSEVGIEKKECSGRHARWLDFNQDGQLDLFVNCHDRENVAGDYPKQLYRQRQDRLFKDVAADVGLDIPKKQIGSFGWFDVDADGDVDVLTIQDDGFFLYRNENGRYLEELVTRRASDRTKKIAHTTSYDWAYDGKLTIGDYDADGDQDAFSASKRGNYFLVNQGGKLIPVDPVSVGLSAQSATANWVDYDNDGLLDLHLIPQGLFRQRNKRLFEQSKLLDFPLDQYDAAICNWFDLDNDGRLDVLMALHENPGFKRWWEFFKEPKRKSSWVVKLFRNNRAENHWLQVRLVGTAGNREGIGASVTLVTPDGRQTQEVGNTEGAFFSQGHYRLYYGLGRHKRADVMQVRWSDGYVQEFKDVVADRLVVVERDQ